MHARNLKCSFEFLLCCNRVGAIFGSCYILKIELAMQCITTKQLKYGLKDAYFPSQKQEIWVSEKIVDSFSYIGSEIYRTNSDLKVRIAKTWQALNKIDVV